MVHVVDPAIFCQACGMDGSHFHKFKEYKNQKMILDFGSRTSQWKWLVEHFMQGCRVVCLDKKPQSQEVIKFDFRGEGTPLPFPKESFDVITCLSVVQYIKNKDFLFKEFYRVLKPNGKVIVTFPIIWNPFNAHGKMGWYCNKAIQRSGLEITEKSKIGTLSYHYLEAIKL
jgi:SAM-dependent methyltransferase